MGFVYCEDTFIIINRTNCDKVREKILNLMRELAEEHKEYSPEGIHEIEVSEDKTVFIIDLRFEG